MTSFDPTRFGPVLRALAEALLAELEDGQVHDRALVRQRVLDRTNGNPKTLENLIADLAVHGVIDRPKNRLRLTTLGRTWALEQGLMEPP